MATDIPEPFPDQPWNRLWLPFSDWESHAWVDDGFVGTIAGQTANKWWITANLATGKGLAPVSLTEVIKSSSNRVTVLLGRPDAGKTHELVKLSAALSGCVLVQAKGIAEPLPQHLDRVFSAAFAEKVPPSILIFDSLDESLIREDNTIESLTYWLKSLDQRLGNKSLRLVLSCRWADWPEASLRRAVDQWTHQKPETWVLLPLVGADAQETTTQILGSRADGFWQEMLDKKLEWFACWPQAFIQMLSAYAEGIELPSSPQKMIESFVTDSLLVTDDADERLRQKQNPESSAWMARVAGRLGAALFFSRSGAIDLAPKEPASAGVLSLSQVVGQEKWNQQWRDVTEGDLSALKDRTSLMRRLPSGHRIVFHSQVSQEYLAAAWIGDQGLALKRLLQLFSSAEVDGGHVFPQLRPLAAAVAERSPEFLKWLKLNDPVTLLHADHSSWSNEARHEIITALLNYTERVQAVDTALWQAHLSTLNHPVVLDQLRPWLENQSRSPAPAEFALQLARKTKPNGLAEFLWSIMPTWRSQDLPTLVRVMVECVTDPHSAEWQARWMDVISRRVPTDREGFLLGTALQEMIPTCLAVRDAADWLVVERTFEVTGRFSFFLWAAGQFVTLSDVPAVLAAMVDANVFSVAGFDYGDPLKYDTWVPFQALHLAFTNLQNPEIRGALESYWAACMDYTAFSQKHHLSSSKHWIHKLKLSNEVRRDFALHFLASHPCKIEHIMMDAASCFLLDHHLDGLWLLEQTVQSSGQLLENLGPLCVDYFLRDEFHQQHRDLLMRVWNASKFIQRELPQGSDGEDPIDRIVRLRKQASEKHAEEDARWKAEHERREAEWATKLQNTSAGLRAEHTAGGIVWPSIVGVLVARQSGRSGAIPSHRHMVIDLDRDAWMSEAARRFLLELPLEQITQNSGMLASLALSCLGPESLADETIGDRIREHWLPWLVDIALDDHPDWLPRRFAWLDRFPDHEGNVFSRLFKDRYHRDDCMLYLVGWVPRWKAMHCQILETLLTQEPMHAAGAGVAWLILANHDFDAACKVLQVWTEQLPTIFEAETRSPVAPSEGIEINPSGFRSMTPTADDPPMKSSTVILALAFTHSRGKFWEQSRLADASTLPGQGLCPAHRRADFTRENATVRMTIRCFSLSDPQSATLRPKFAFFQEELWEQNNNINHPFTASVPVWCRRPFGTTPVMRSNGSISR